MKQAAAGFLFALGALGAIGLARQFFPDAFEVSLF